MEKNSIMVLADEVKRETKWVKPKNLKIKVDEKEVTLGELIEKNAELEKKLANQEQAINNILESLKYLGANIELVKAEVM